MYWEVSSSIAVASRQAPQPLIAGVLELFEELTDTARWRKVIALLGPKYTHLVQLSDDQLLACAVTLIEGSFQSAVKWVLDRFQANAGSAHRLLSIWRMPVRMSCASYGCHAA
jgi:hypothetical protein